MILYRLHLKTRATRELVSSHFWELFLRRSDKALPASALLFRAALGSMHDCAAIRYISWYVTAEYKLLATSVMVRRVLTSSIP